jgi:hypothetical protein
LKEFAKIIDQKYEERKEKQWTDPKWTEFMGEVFDDVAKKMNCHAARRRPGDKEDSGEYLGIDAVFIDKSEYGSMEESWNPSGLPCAVVEHENRYAPKIISYALWKILCVRASIRVLICYQDNKRNVNSLKEKLEDDIWQGSLMKGTNADLLVIIGNSVEEDQPWSVYFTVYEWRSDSLKKITVPVSGW